MDTDRAQQLVDAASTGKIDVLEQLLEKNIQKETFQSIIRTTAAAAWKSQTSTVIYILSKYPWVPLPEENIRTAIYSWTIDLFPVILSKDPTIIDYQFDWRGTSIALACMSKQLFGFLEFLLKTGADPNQDPDIAPPPLVSVVAFYSDTKVAELLLKYGARLENSGDLETAVKKGNKAIVRDFMDHGAKTDKKGAWCECPSFIIIFDTSPSQNDPSSSIYTNIQVSVQISRPPRDVGHV